MSAMTYTLVESVIAPFVARMKPVVGATVQTRIASVRWRVWGRQVNPTSLVVEAINA